MRIIRKHPILFLITTAMLLALSCQAVTRLQTAAPTADTNSETIVEQAVATVAAETDTADNQPPVVNSSLPPVEVDLQTTLIDLYKSVNSSVVHIFVFDEQGFNLGTGSGFVFDENGHIVTNNHVIADSATLEVVFSTGERRRAEITGRDVDSDLAVIRVSAMPPGIEPLPLGDSSQLSVGEFVIAIGNPFGEEGSMSIGIISGLERTIDSQRILPGGGTFSIPQVIQTDAAINPGNSGGPLLDLQGQVVGVNSAIQSQTGVNSGVGFSIPVNAVKRIVPALIEDGRYRYPYIGISMVPRPFTLDELEALDLPPNGVFITDVSEDTPAEEAGLIGHNLADSFTADGDYIIAVDGQRIKSSDDLLSYLVFETEVDQTIELTLIRNGEEITVPLTLGERP